MSIDARDGQKRGEERGRGNFRNYGEIIPCSVPSQKFIRKGERKGGFQPYFFLYPRGQWPSLVKAGEERGWTKGRGQDSTNARKPTISQEETLEGDDTLLDKQLASYRGYSCRNNEALPNKTSEGRFQTDICSKATL